MIDSDKLDNVVNNIYLELFGKPKTHHDFANGFNIRGRIKRTIINSKGLTRL